MTKQVYQGPPTQVVVNVHHRPSGCAAGCGCLILILVGLLALSVLMSVSGL